MEQLFEAFGINWKLLLAQAVNFGVLLVALRYFLYRPVMDVLEKRRILVAKGVEDAQAATEKLAQADTEASARLSVAETQASEIVETARHSATDEKTRIVKDAELRAARVAEDAELRAKEVAAKTLRESEQEISRLAILAAGKVLAEKS
ncbi:MAG: ATP synthase F0 subunit B [Minisyncoccia bacterium]